MLAYETSRQGGLVFHYSLRGKTGRERLGACRAKHPKTCGNDPLRRVRKVLSLASATLPGMKVFRNHTAALVGLLCGTLLLTRIGSDHLHFCLDGQEPPVAVHGADGGLHHVDSEAGQPLNDRDVDLMKVIGEKKQTQASLFALISASSGFERLPRVVVRWTPTPDLGRFLSPSRHLHPPQRGPPS